MVKSGGDRPMLLARGGGGVFGSRVSPLKSGLWRFLDALFFMALALTLHSEVLKIQTYHYFSALKFILARVYKKDGKNQLPKVVAGVKFRNEYGVIVDDNSCFIIARHQLLRITRPKEKEAIDGGLF
jgi:hypothetical protein